MTNSISSAIRRPPSHGLHPAHTPPPHQPPKVVAGWGAGPKPSQDPLKRPLSVFKTRAEASSLQELQALKARLTPLYAAAKKSRSIPQTFDLARRLDVVDRCIGERRAATPATRPDPALSLPLREFQARAKASTTRQLFAMRDGLEHAYQAARRDESKPQNREVIRRYDTVCFLINQRSGFDGGGE